MTFGLLHLRGRSRAVRPSFAGRPCRIRRTRRVATLLLWASMGAWSAACGRTTEDRVFDAQALLDAGQANEAIATLREALESDPDDVAANQLLGVALLQAGQPGAAVFPLEKAAEKALAENDANPSLVLAKALLHLQRGTDAVRALDRVIAALPDHTGALRLRAESRIQANQSADALADTQRLVALAPEDFSAAVMNASVLAASGRVDEARKEYERARKLGADSQDPGLAARGCFALAQFEADRKSPAAAEEYARCAREYPADLLGLRLATAFFDGAGRPEEATALWRRAVEQAPESIELRARLAERLRRAGDGAGAMALLREAAESSGLPEAWRALAEHQRSGGDLSGAEESLNRAIEASSGTASEGLRAALAGLRIESGRFDEAQALIDALSDPGQRSLLRGRLLLERGDAGGALAALDDAVRRWPDQAGVRYLAGSAALRAGDAGRAEQELREALRADPSGSDAALALAQLAFEAGDGAQAVQLARGFLQLREGRRPDGLRILARAQGLTGDFDGARETLGSLEKLPDQRSLAAVERAWLESRAQGPGAAVRAIEDSRVDLTDPANEEALRALAEGLIAQGDGARALERVDAALAKHPDHARYHELRGAVLTRIGRGDDARASFEKALSIDPQLARALSGLGALSVAAGDLDAAFGMFERAAAIDPGDANAAYAAAQIVLAQGKEDEAVRRLRAVVARSPGHSGAANDLAWVLASRGQDLDLALALAERAHRLAPQPDLADTLGWVHLQRGEVDAAIAAFEKAVAGKPHDPTLRYHLGIALARKGDRDRALAALRDALGAGAFPDADAARQEIARLESQ